MKDVLIAKADQYLGKKQDQELLQFLSAQDFHVIANIIDGLPRGKRKSFAILPPEKQAEVALVLSERSKKSVIPRLNEEAIARFLHFNDEDDATDILQYLAPPRRTKILLNMKDEKRRKIEKLLKFGSETAGGLMDLNFILVKPGFTQRDVISKVQLHLELQKQIPTVLVTGERGKILGFIPERSLIFLSQDSTVADIEQPVPLALHTMDREKVIQMISRMRSEVVCVVDEEENVLGVIHLRDLLKVAQAEATEDVYRFAGVDVDEHALDSVTSKVSRRYNWLIVNLATAFLAAFVVSLFEETISRFAILAVYMPVVAGQGGNAATQALAVVVRAMALGEIGWSRASRVIIKEAFAGTINGVITGLIAGAAAVLLGGPPVLGLILCISMIINLFVAGFFGAFIPFVLRRMKIDPATASTVFVTTTTDVFGFLTFLGLGAMFLR